jgi:hypothetical protein
MIDVDGVQELAGDLLAAVQDRLDGGAADEVGQAADHPAGAAMQVLVERGQGAGLVTVQAQRVFERGDQALPFGGEREREGGDEGEPARDLASAGAGEQAFALDVDAGVDERGGDALGEVL